MMKLWAYLLLILVLSGMAIQAHPMPRSVMLLNVQEKGISAELQWPLKEFQVVFPAMDIDSHATSLIDRMGPWLDTYLLQHMSLTDDASHSWTVTILGKKIKDDLQPMTGSYHELVYSLWLQPPPGVSPRRFILHYDAILHQLVTHKMLIRVRQDWDGGMLSKDSTAGEIGVLMVNTGDGKIPPVVVNLDEGSKWKGFKNMVGLGIQHIAEGTDHLLFLLVLLLPCALVAVRGRWAGFSGVQQGLTQLFKIITAFTAGHSVSLILGSLKLFVLPSQLVEIGIGLTIFITAIHAIRPVFAGGEVLVAGFFGLIHGLAFATFLSDLDLDPSRLATSILGFNIGIELMQLFVIACTVPWIILLSTNRSYPIFRIIGAVVACVASIGWIAERVTGYSNVITHIIQKAANESKWLIAGLVCFTLLVKGWEILSMKNKIRII